VLFVLIGDGAPPWMVRLTDTATGATTTILCYCICEHRCRPLFMIRTMQCAELYCPVQTRWRAVDCCSDTGATECAGPGAYCSRRLYPDPPPIQGTRVFPSRRSCHPPLLGHHIRQYYHWGSLRDLLQVSSTLANRCP
jgi:hypothetical protein